MIISLEGHKDGLNGQICKGSNLGIEAHCKVKQPLGELSDVFKSNSMFITKYVGYVAIGYIFRQLIQFAFARETFYHHRNISPLSGLLHSGLYLLLVFQFLWTIRLLPKEYSYSESESVEQRIRGKNVVLDKYYSLLK